MYKNGVMLNLGTLAGSNGMTSTALGVNDQDQVVGNSLTAGFEQHAFLYSNGVMQDLNNLLVPGSQVTLFSATGINDHGQIIADGDNALGQQHAFLLTPQSVPEPSSLLLAATALLIGLTAARRRAVVSLA